jgi:hypothetical protein
MLSWEAKILRLSREAEGIPLRIKFVVLDLNMAIICDKSTNFSEFLNVGVSKKVIIP